MGTIQDQASSCITLGLLQDGDAGTQHWQTKKKDTPPSTAVVFCKNKKHQKGFHNLAWTTGKTLANRCHVSALSLPNHSNLSLLTDLHAFFYLQNPITPVALWEEMLFTHIIMAPNKIRHHSWEEIWDCVRVRLLWMLLGLFINQKKWINIWDWWPVFLNVRHSDVKQPRMCVSWLPRPKEATAALYKMSENWSKCWSVSPKAYDGVLKCLQFSDIEELRNWKIGFRKCWLSQKNYIQTDWSVIKNNWQLSS